MRIGSDTTHDVWRIHPRGDFSLPSLSLRRRRNFVPRILMLPLSRVLNFTPPKSTEPYKHGRAEYICIYIEMFFSCRVSFRERLSSISTLKLFSNSRRCYSANLKLLSELYMCKYCVSCFKIFQCSRCIKSPI